MTTKVDIINGAYTQMRISGLTVDPTPEDVEVALDRLEDMCAELEDSRNICIGYNFEEQPDPNSLTDTKRKYSHMLKTNLAMRLLHDFGKVPPPTLANQASQSLSTASSAVAAENARGVQYTRRKLALIGK